MTGLALAALSATASQAVHAQNFSYATTVTPTQITDHGGTLYSDGAGALLTGTPSTIVLATFYEQGTTGTRKAPQNFDGGFDISVYFTSPPLNTGNIQQQQVLSDVTGTFSSLTYAPGVQTASDVTASFNSPTTSFNFGNYGTFTLSNFQYTDTANNILLPDGVITADVNFTPVPEPGTWAAFAFMALGAGGLLLRARKFSRTGGVAA